MGRGAIRDEESLKTAPSINFLEDQPSESDFFGSHSRVAKAIADVIRNANSVNVIGLLGGWGSGKSTVVRQIAKKLDTGPGEETAHLFTYDAWLHQNDPPRRAFLEALIGDFTSQKLVKEDDWKPRLADLSGRSEETVTQTSRQLSTTGKWIFLSLALVPLGLGLLDFDLIDRVFGDKPSALAARVFWLGLALTIAPVFVVIGFYLGWRPWRDSYRRNGWRLLFDWKFLTEHRGAYKDQSILALLTNQSVERSENRTRISPEPTAIEFRAVFRDLLRSIEGHKKRLVIVIDNLDRLAEADAMQLWATIRSLFLGGEASIQTEPGLRAPAIILPIDESAIARMFSIAHPKEADELAAAFVDKTFDITFHVNEPVMSDWRAYLGGKLEEAFGSLATPERIYWATKITEEKFADDGTRGKAKITPRKLIKLVNSVAALVVQWGDDIIDFVTMVFYVTHRHAIASNIREFIKGDWSSMDAAVDDWRRQIVALHFGVPPDKAFQVLLHEPLRSAVNANDREEFDKWIQVDGAWAIMEEIVDNPPADADKPTVEARFVANAALLISTAPQIDNIRAKRMLDRLCQYWGDAADIGAIRADFADIVTSLSGSLTTATVGPFLASSAQKLGAAISKSNLSEGAVDAFTKAIETLETVAKNHNASMSAIPLGMDTNGLFSLLKNLPPHYRRHVRTDKSGAEITTALEAALSDESASSLVPHAVRALAHSPTIAFKDKGKLDWDSVVNAASSIVQSHALDHHSMSAAIDVLGLLHSTNPNAKNLVSQQFDQGRLATLLNEADQQNEESTLADIAALMLLKGTDFSGPNGKNWEQVLQDHQGFLTSLDAALDWYRPSQRTTFALKAQKTRPSFVPVIRALARLGVTENSSNGITTSYLLTNLASLSEALGEELLDKCVTDAGRRPDFWSSLDELEIGAVYDANVVRLSKVDTIDRGKLIDDIRAKLERTDQATWDGAIRQGSPPYDLALMFRSDFGQKAIASDHLKQALTDSRTELLKTDGAMRENWFSLVGFIPKTSRVVMLRSLKDGLLAGNEVVELADLIAIGGEMLMSEGKFADEADKTARHVILRLVSQDSGRSALLAQAAFFKGVVAKSDKDTKAAIAEALEAAAEAEDEQGEQVANLKLALALG